MGLSPNQQAMIDWREVQSRAAQRPAAPLTRDEVLTRLSEQANGSMRDFVTINEQGEAQIDLRKAAINNKLGLIKKLRIKPEGAEIELYDAQVALGHLCRCYRMYGDQADASREPVEIIYVNDWR